jgi:hypothetical protein
MDDRESGCLPVWVRCVIGAASILTLMIAVFAPRAFFDHLDLYGHDVGFFRDGPAILLSVWLALSFVAVGRFSAWMQVALLLPLAHLLVMVMVWLEWVLYSDALPHWLRASALVVKLPFPLVVGALAAICALAGRSIARHRPRDWLQVSTTIALVDLLLLGLWLPIAAALWCHGDPWWDPDDELVRSYSALAPLLATVLGPPLVGAIAFARFTHRDRTLVARRSLWFGLAVVLLLLAAVVMRAEPSYAAASLYVRFAHVLLATALVAIGTVAWLAVALGLRARRSRRAVMRDPLRRAGVVATSSDDVRAGRIEITSWLRGPQLVVAPCSVQTPQGEVLVPGGAELVAHLSTTTTRLATGEAEVALRAGDRVIVSGYTPPPDGHPFRDSTELVPQHVRVARAHDHGSTLGDVALSLWRPCVAYLLILAAVALPAVITALAGGDAPARDDIYIVE